MPKREEVYRVVNQERGHQDRADVGRRAEELDHQLGSHLALMQAKLNQALAVYATGQKAAGYEVALDHVRELTALGVRCMEKHGALPG